MRIPSPTPQSYHETDDSTLAFPVLLYYLSEKQQYNEYFLSPRHTAPQFYFETDDATLAFPVFNYRGVSGVNVRLASQDRGG